MGLGYNCNEEIVVPGSQLSGIRASPLRRHSKLKPLPKRGEGQEKNGGPLRQLYLWRLQFRYCHGGGQEGISETCIYPRLKNSAQYITQKRFVVSFCRSREVKLMTARKSKLPSRRDY